MVGTGTQREQSDFPGFPCREDILNLLFTTQKIVLDVPCAINSESWEHGRKQILQK